MRLSAAGIFGLVIPLIYAVPAVAAGPYPTTTIVDYVYGCMKANGQTRAALENCSCSIDVIASIIPYEDYETAETFKRMGLLTGEKGVLFRQSVPAKAAITELKRAQAEADIRCF